MQSNRFTLFTQSSLGATYACSLLLWLVYRQGLRLPLLTHFFADGVAVFFFFACQSNRQLSHVDPIDGSSIVVPATLRSFFFVVPATACVDPPIDVLLFILVYLISSERPE